MQYLSRFGSWLSDLVKGNSAATIILLLLIGVVILVVIFQGLLPLVFSALGLGGG